MIQITELPTLSGMCLLSNQGLVTPIRGVSWEAIYILERQN